MTRGLSMRMTGRRVDLLQRLTTRWPAAGTPLNRSRHIKGQLLPYQAAALFILAQAYNRKDARILEIGTGQGYSASIIAQACPKAAEIITLNPCEAEAEKAEANLVGHKNVKVTHKASWDYWDTDNANAGDSVRRGWSLIFVDGDHKHVGRDMPWWNRCGPGSLMLFHDYTEKGSPPVVECVDRLGLLLRRSPAVLLLDDEGVGMAGFYVRAGDKKWPT